MPRGGEGDTAQRRLAEEGIVEVVVRRELQLPTHAEIRDVREEQLDAAVQQHPQVRVVVSEEARSEIDAAA